MTNRIVKIQPTENYFSISWQLSIRCNYDCMYCSPAWHDNTSKHYDLETMQQAWTNLFEKTKHHGLPYKISFTGGEPTTNKNFLPFVQWLRTEFNPHLFKVLLSTNGSASYRYYREMFEYIDNITFSTHSEHMDEQRFFDTVIQLRKNIAPNRFVQVAVMEESWNQQRIEHYIKLLELNDISYTVNRIDYSVKTRDVPVMKGKLNLAI